MAISEILVFGLIVAGFMLFNYVLQRLANKARQTRQDTQTAENTTPVPASAHDLLDYTWGQATPAPPLAQASANEDLAAATAPPEPSAAVSAPLHPAVHGLLRGRAELHDAIVLMTVLGPCRAIEPEDHR